MQFNDDQFNRSTYDVGPKGLTGWLINKGIAKDIKGANTILLIVFVVFITITAILIWPESGGIDLRVEEIERAGSLEEISDF